jgi:hypothetical protein
VELLGGGVGLIAEATSSRGGGGRKVRGEYICSSPFMCFANCELTHRSRIIWTAATKKTRVV